MNKDIVLLTEDVDSITIKWDKEDFESGYTIMGMNDYSCFEIIGKTASNVITLNRNRIKKYHCIRIDYMYLNGDKETYVGSTNTLKVTSKLFDLLKLKFLKSYSGITVAITNDRYYAKYRLYEKIKNAFVMIYETEDFVFTSSLFVENKTYLIEGYTKEEDNYVLNAKSMPFNVKYDDIKEAGKTPYLSIVVPCYNRENYITRCIDSLLLSTFDDREIILVDDASTDKSNEILKWYEKTYKGIIKLVENKKNSGIAVSRNNGILKAKGKYIAFIDSDDYVHPKMYEYLCETAKKEELDVVIGKTLIKNKIDDTTVCLDLVSLKSYRVFTYDEMYKNKMECTPENIFFTSTCNKIAKTSLVKKHLFPDLRVYEDTAFTRTLYSYVDKFGFCYRAYYVWDKRDNELVETISSSTKTNSEINFHELYRAAIFHSVYEGNPKRIDELEYDALSELYRYLKGLKENKAYEKFYNYYIDEIVKYNEQHKILDNKYIKECSELHFFLIKILKKHK